MKRCELCKSFARIYCESDQASLCWNCDAKVHSANFLVAKHSRCILCHSCQSPTRWSASGEKLEPATVSICDRCVFDGEEDETDLDDKEVRDENQVVPWSSTPPPPASSSSGSELEFRIAGRCVSMKRQRQNVADLSCLVDNNSSMATKKHRKRSSTVTEQAIGGDEAAQIQSLPSRSESIVKKLDINCNLNMISDSDDNESATVVGKSKATRGVGFDLNTSPSL